MTRSLFDADPCANKHGGNPQSVEAYQRGQHRHRSLRERIVALLEDKGPAGLTRDAIAARLGRAVHSISGRVSELLAEDPPRVCETGRREQTSAGGTGAVLVHVRWLGERTLDVPSAIRERM